jgi:N-acetylmuramate 1-kinase
MPETSDPRSAALWSWFIGHCAATLAAPPQGVIEPVSGDASFRRYFRGHAGKRSWILVDAPPEKEDSRGFLAVQRSLHQAGVRVPAVLAADLAQGFMCLGDFGNTLLLARLTEIQAHRANSLRDEAATALYRQAGDELLKIQCCDPAAPPLPLFDRAMLLREMQLFSTWLCEGLLQLELDTASLQMWTAVQEILVESALAQPQVYVHRDYHSRNLMLLDDGLGVLDFQDAVLGPFTYDLVSLLKDCYIKWPLPLVRSWALDYLHRAQAQGLAKVFDDASFIAAFDLMGVQRHLKAAGIFCRLYLRDGKAGYLKDIPRTLSYITDLGFTEGALGEFSAFLQTRILPALQLRLSEIGGQVT